MFHILQLWNFSFCRRVTAQLVGDDFPRYPGTGCQHAFEETFRLLVAMLLQQEVAFDTVLVDRSPEYIRFASQAVELHVNKGLAGAPPGVNEQARQCVTNPKVADAFAVMNVATGGPPPFADLPITPPNMAQAHRNAAGVAKAPAVLKARHHKAALYFGNRFFS
jgi:hypothetical protein